MAERRSDALATPLASDTKGFQMLAAMGYRLGQGIGKTIIGRAAPVDVNLKAGRTGLGVDEAKRGRDAAAQQERQEREAKRLRGQDGMRSTFLQDRGASFARRRAEGHLVKARVVCETLDQRDGIAESQMWPLPPPPQGDDVAGADAADAAADCASVWEDLPAEQRLSEVLDHLRQRHHYCFFCGCQYNGEEDMRESCPGKWEDDH
ncbi:hypothetical protein WJX81_000993 [Elliptochloris bilobata]|uniref:G-patch domain-containing protein n=1 Tax=Elliptochloris bilobata TaxID=381761 RepID=A0AAW1RY75_9CHLO